MTTTSLIYHLVQNSLGWPSWLERIYQRQLLRQAVARAYPTFARQYPEWVEYLFDEHFLNQHGIPLLAAYIANNAMPTPSELAQVWSEQFAWFNLEMKQRHIAQLLPVAADFLRCLDKELFN